MQFFEMYFLLMLCSGDMQIQDLNTEIFRLIDLYEELYGDQEIV